MSQFEQPRFIFLHIPKTGGMTLKHIIFRQFKGVKSLNLRITKKLNTKPLSSFTEKERNELRLISGHFAFSDDFIFPDATNYFTMLREPVKRVISQYNYLYSNTQHAFNKTMVEKNYSLYDMLSQGYVKHFDNCLVRFLSGSVFKDFGTIDEADYQKALQNFDKYFTHFGLNEHFDESILMLSYELNWKFPYYAHINTTKTKKTDITFDAQTNAALVKCTQFDKRLYDYAFIKFQTKLAENKARLQQDVTKLEKGNTVRNFWLKLHYLINEKKINRVEL